MHAIEIVILSLLILCIGWVVQSGIKRKKTDTIPFSNIEEKALMQIEQIHYRFLREEKDLKHRQLFNYFKKLKIILAVYMWERFDITVKDRITEHMREKMYHASDHEKLFFTNMFNRLRKIKTDSMTYENIEKLCRDTIDYFRTKSE